MKYPNKKVRNAIFSPLTTTWVLLLSLAISQISFFGSKLISFSTSLIGRGLFEIYFHGDGYKPSNTRGRSFGPGFLRRLLLDQISF